MSQGVHVSVHYRLFLYSLFKKLAFVPVASAITAVCSDRRILASNAPWTSVADSRTDRQTDRQIQSVYMINAVIL